MGADKNPLAKRGFDSGARFPINVPTPRMKTPRPLSAAEWQSAVDFAMAALVLGLAYERGLMPTIPEANQDRACQILGIAKQRGIEPIPDAVERLVIATICKQRRRVRKLLEIGLERPNNPNSAPD